MFDCFCYESRAMGCAAPHPLHWSDLRSLDPGQILKKPGVTSSPGGVYHLAFLDARYHVDPVKEQIRELHPQVDRCLSQAFQILLLRYLISENIAEINGQTITEKELPGGTTFFQGPHALQLDPVLKRFGSDPEALLQRGAALGAEPVQHGDAAIRLLPFPLIPVTYVLWRADDEFPASVSVLFDRSITDWFELDMVFILVMELSKRLASD
jgi:hypothetical protein